MESKNVHIHISSEQELEQDDTMVVQNIPGIRTDDKKGKIYLRYEEKMEGVDEKVRTLITIQGGTLHIKRSGGVKTTMDFLVGKKTTCEYFMPMGVMHFEIRTEELKIIDTVDTLEITLKYSMAMEGEVVSVNSLSLKTEVDESFSDVKINLV